jgi:glycosyltransferase involved in cell wall biosynthesis
MASRFTLRYSFPMRILITTGIFVPESGGPAKLTPKIATRLVEDGHEVTVMTYSDKSAYDFDSKYPFKLVRIVRRGNRVLNYGAFFISVLRHLRGCDIAYSLDWLAAGLPLTLASYVWRVPVVIRVGGDYIWERYLETGAEPMPATDFYDRGLHTRFRLMFLLIRFVLRNANRVVFNSDIQREMYHEQYGLTPQQTAVIYNPVPAPDWVGISRDGLSEEIVFAGRLVAQKNVETLVRAFARAQLSEGYTLVIIGDGPEQGTIELAARELGLGGRVSFFPSMSQKNLYARVRNCRAMVLPSWTDQSPNQVFEAMQLKIPMLVTKENYLAIRDELPEKIDPRSVADIAAKLEMLADETRYAAFVAAWNALSFDYDWDREMHEHYAVFDSVLRK